MLSLAVITCLAASPSPATTLQQRQQHLRQGLLSQWGHSAQQHTTQAPQRSMRVEQVVVDLELDLAASTDPAPATPVLQGIAAAVASSVPNAVGLRLKGVVGSLHGAVVVQGTVLAPPLTAITIEQAMKTWTNPEHMPLFAELCYSQGLDRRVHIKGAQVQRRIDTMAPFFSSEVLASKLALASGMRARSASLVVMLMLGSAIVLLGAVATTVVHRFHPRVFDDEALDGDSARSLGVSEDVIGSLPIKSFREKVAASVEEGDDDGCTNHFNATTCAICLGEFEDQVEVKELPCVHLFHPECIDEWLRSRGSCPLCNQRVVDEESEEDGSTDEDSDEEDEAEEDELGGNGAGGAEDGEEDQGANRALDSRAEPEEHEEVVEVVVQEALTATTEGGEGEDEAAEEAAAQGLLGGDGSSSAGEADLTAPLIPRP